MIQQQFELRFSTPAFLGNANQSGQWRTPPFKAQLRQWWRVAYAAKQGFDVNVAEMRFKEGKLFGHAWLENDFEDGKKTAGRKSEVRIRLGLWSEGKLLKKDWVPLDPVIHPEVNVKPPADLYLGFGPVTIPRGEHKPTLQKKAAIGPGDFTSFAVAYPDADDATLIEQALNLMNLYGTVGGRSRNGWGSYSLVSETRSTQLENLPLRDWQECLQQDWPHAIGKDSKGALIWYTKPHDDWKSLMKELAVIKIGLRTQFKFTTGKNAPQPEDRHWLSYPVTNHSVAAWGGNARLPNSLRFKIRPTSDGKLIGVVFHMPCLPTLSFNPDPDAVKNVWARVHGHLDKQTALTRAGE